MNAHAPAPPHRIALADAMPDALAPLVAERRWLVWRWKLLPPKPGKPPKWTKEPFQAARPDRNASSTRPSTWGSYEEARAAVAAGHAHGIGFALHGSEWTAFDGDDCRDPETGRIADWAMELIERGGSYVEATVSGTGIRILGRGVGAKVHRKQRVPGCALGSVETYRRAERYIVVTGHSLEESTPELADLDELIDETVARLDGAAEAEREAKRAERNREREKPRAERAGSWRDLPLELERLIRDGVPEGERSTQFHHVVGWLKQLGWQPSEIEAELSRYPHGIAEKYEGRLGDQVQRSFDRTEEPRSGAGSAAGGGQSGPQEPPPGAGFQARPFVWIDPSKIPLRQWLMDRHLIRKYVAVMASPGGFGKSSLVNVDALALVTGRNLIGHQPHGRHRVLIWNGEDPLEELQRRIIAACLYFEIAPEEIEGRLFVNSGRDDPITVATVERNGIRIAVPTVEAFTATLRDNAIDAFFIDPFVSCHAVPENDNMMIDRVAKLFGSIAGVTNSAGELVHHTKKTGGAEVTMEDMRGAVALLSAARSGRILNGMTKDEAERAGVKDRRLHFRVDNGKANLAPPPSDGSAWFKLASVPLMNGGELGGVPLEGDHVGVVTAWTWPDPLAGIDVADLRAAQAAVREGGPWRENVQAKDWVGLPIARALRLDPEDKADREKVKRLLRVWIGTGMFTVVTGKDAKGNDRPFVEVGEVALD